MKVYLVLDHEDFTVAVFASMDSAEAYIVKEWAALPGPVLWHVEETEVRP